MTAPAPAVPVPDDLPRAAEVVPEPPLDEALRFAETPVERSGPGVVVRWLAAFVPTGALGAAAYLTTDHVPTEPVRWIASGAIAGLLLGWITVRWMARRH
jgi:hypothetical protein